MPARVAGWLGRRLGDLAWLLLGRRRRIALGNVRSAFPDLSPRAQRRLARDSFEHAGTTALELCGLLHGAVEQAARDLVIDGREHLDAALRVRGSVLVVTAHLGNWELLSLLQRRVDQPVAIVVRPLDARWLDGLIERLRSRTGVAIIAKQNAVRPILDGLKRGQAVAILLDQNASRREGVFVPFFGRLASTSRSVAAIASRTGTPILPVFIRREGPGRHRVTMHPPLTPPSGISHDDAIVDLTERCTAMIERAIRAAPEQWLWFHDRWRTRPASERTGGA